MTNFIEFLSTIAIFFSCFAWLTNRIDQQNARTERLYEMFISMLKDKKE